MAPSVVTKLMRSSPKKLGILFIALLLYFMMKGKVLLPVHEVDLHHLLYGEKFQNDDIICKAALYLFPYHFNDSNASSEYTAI